MENLTRKELKERAEELISVTYAHRETRADANFSYRMLYNIFEAFIQDAAYSEAVYTFDGFQLTAPKNTREVPVITITDEDDIDEEIKSIVMTMVSNQEHYEKKKKLAAELIDYLQFLEQQLKQQKGLEEPILVKYTDEEEEMLYYYVVVVIDGELIKQIIHKVEVFGGSVY